MPKVVVNGIEMHHVLKGRGPALVFLPGLGRSLEAWRPFIPFFSARWRVIAADTRGHGESSKPEGPYAIELFANDWHALLDHLGVEKAVLLGLSMGGGPLLCRWPPCVRSGSGPLFWWTLGQVQTQPSSG